MSEKSERIDLGIAVLHALAKPGEQLTIEDIAVWADCDTETIRNIEAKAMEKVRRKLWKLGVNRLNAELV